MSPQEMKPQLQYLQPCLGDATRETNVDATYFYQDAWAFERIYQRKPPFHVDVGSHHKYVSMLSKVVPVTMVDIRPLPVSLESLNFKEGNILNLPYEDNSVPSVSSICVIEHIGLGRYGDPLDPHGSEKAIKELKRIVQPGGDLLISLPLDDASRIYFNAHRTFTESQVIEFFAPYTVVDKKYIYGTSFTSVLHSGFGVGCYHFRKPV
jgi:SAM-dependent methyltransferase